MTRDPLIVEGEGQNSAILESRIEPSMLDKSIVERSVVKDSLTKERGVEESRTEGSMVKEEVWLLNTASLDAVAILWV